MSILLKKHFQMNKETIATIFGGLIGTCKAIISNEFIAALLVAFATGAAAWLGQTIAKWGWIYFNNWLKTLKK